MTGRSFTKTQQDRGREQGARWEDNDVVTNIEISLLTPWVASEICSGNASEELSLLLTEARSRCVHTMLVQPRQRGALVGEGLVV